MYIFESEIEKLLYIVAMAGRLFTNLHRVSLRQFLLQNATTLLNHNTIG